MYKYDAYDQQLIDERAAQYRDQTERFLRGEIPDDEFLQLRLRNGLYVQRLAPMFRICIPYGMLSSTQLRKLAELSRDYDKGYGHFTTRQNIQFHWPKLEEVPDIQAGLATVQMHPIQTSGSCIRNTTTDQFAGVSADEIEDSRPYCELIRQWSTFHPEFNWLPRKFKIAVSGCERDRAAIAVHDIGINLVRNDQQEVGFQILVGGGLGRTPVIGSVIREFLPKKHLLTYLESILRVYNRFGRRDNKFKARIKILVRAMTPKVFAQKVEEDWVHLKDGAVTITDAELARVASFFTTPPYEELSDEASQVSERIADDSGFKNWTLRNVSAHKQPGYAIVTLALSRGGVAPGDVSDEQMELVADLADRYSFGEIRVTHEQNLVLADVRKTDLYSLWQELRDADLGTPNLGLLTDMICCPGGDFCSLANAKSLPVAEAIQRRFNNLAYLHDLGDIDLNISGCMNACGHHHVGNIGILGVDKKGIGFFQVSIGGSGYEDASLGKILGPSFPEQEIPDVIETILNVYMDRRNERESFISTVRRIGLDPFKAAVYVEE
jgi:sulfite reductase (NADPH) hemoprotein beta-component|tara:strand:- start:21059 stop:22714 length:1656 start_codon:yes stop_codon:yes gene_type:complete